jgi:hypothetical protein
MFWWHAAFVGLDVVSAARRPRIRRRPGGFFNNGVEDRKSSESPANPRIPACSGRPALRVR